jgi:hypothetical protein
MMQEGNHNALVKIDWNALDKSWADQYEEDYGCHFSNGFFHNIKTHIQASPHLEDFMISSL